MNNQQRSAMQIALQVLDGEAEYLSNSFPVDADKANAAIAALRDALSQPQSLASIKLPIDVTIGCGTIKAGCSLQTLLTRIDIINETWGPKQLSRPALITRLSVPESNVQCCNWTQTYDDAEQGAWKTDCDGYWYIIDGSPSDNKMKFCHGCGKPIAEHPYVEAEDAE